MQALFYGSMEVAVDAKGRLSLPSEFREVFARAESLEHQGRFYLIPRAAEDSSVKLSHAACVGGALLENLGFELESCSMARASIIEQLLPTVEMVRFDSVGRLTLSAGMVEHLSLKERAVFVGVGRFFELWSPALVGEQRAAEVAMWRAELRKSFMNTRPAASLGQGAEPQRGGQG